MEQPAATSTRRISSYTRRAWLAKSSATIAPSSSVEMQPLTHTVPPATAAGEYGMSSPLEPTGSHARSGTVTPPTTLRGRGGRLRTVGEVPRGCSAADDDVLRPARGPVHEVLGSDAHQLP